MEAQFVRGIIPAIITPMTEDEELDERGFQKLVDALIEAGVHGIFSVGTAGEFWALSVEEKKRVYHWTVAYVDRRVPVYVGTCANSTREAVRLSELAQQAGADCISVLTPSYIKPNEEEMFNHYAAIARSVDIPILLYNLPARTGNSLSVGLVMRLVETFDNIVGIKDSSGDFSNALAYLFQAPQGFRFVMGNDALIFPALLQGAAAAIVATANVAPEIAVGIYENFVKGDLDVAKEFQKRLTPIRRAFTLGTHPAMLKAGAEMVGFAGGPPRAPVGPLSASQREQLKEMLVEIGKLK
ncbi:MAG: 4-hydroxy-tetrahydrodipicolinate synthase [Deltaproteobacteria bacterium]|nr:4-hydroxy-tetrahydrodipicolinate synthase [Deltaproteobacteria bacterium]